MTMGHCCLVYNVYAVSNCIPEMPLNDTCTLILTSFCPAIAAGISRWLSTSDIVRLHVIPLLFCGSCMCIYGKSWPEKVLGRPTFIVS